MNAATFRNLKINFIAGLREGCCITCGAIAVKENCKNLVAAFEKQRHVVNVPDIANETDPIHCAAYEVPRFHFVVPPFSIMGAESALLLLPKPALGGLVINRVFPQLAALAAMLANLISLRR
ncbi:hypothetical protein ACK8QS_22625 (plasmid) [Ectopseudomonas mendocina]